MKTFFLSTALCLICLPVAAQLIDVLGATGVGGASTIGSTRSVAKGMSVLQQNNLGFAVQQTVMEIQTNFGFRGYQNLNKSMVSNSSLNSYQWNVGPVDNTHFFLEIQGLDTSSCRRVLELVQGAQSVQVNNQKNLNCSDNSKIKWIFE